jgi:hypothetical protein
MERRLRVKVLLDADMIAHEIGHLHDDDGNLLEWGKMTDLVKGRFWSIYHKVEGSSINSFVSGGHTFRHDVASILPYKGNRAGDDRHCADAIKKYLVDELNAYDCIEYEADDALAMAMWDEYEQLSTKYKGDEFLIAKHMEQVIASRDKDLNTVAGWHWVWALKNKVQKLPYFITRVMAHRFFYGQMLMGDTVDNIKGLYNVGEKSRWVKDLEFLENEEDMHLHVYDKYQKYFGQLARSFFKETGQLLHLWRKPNDVWLPFDERDDDYYEINDNHLPF